MRTVSVLALAVVVTALASGRGRTAPPERTDLTGKWTCNDGGTYYIRQVGDELWWSGESAKGEGKKREFSNIFHGTIKGNKVVGSWADDPSGENTGAGKMTLEIVGDGKDLQLKRLKETGDFGGSVWTPKK